MDESGATGYWREMSYPRPMVRHMDGLSLCGEPVELSLAEIGALKARPDPVNEIEPTVECELQAGHRGRISRSARLTERKPGCGCNGCLAGAGS